MPAKGTMGAIALLRKYYMDDDSARFKNVVDSIHAMAMTNGFVRGANGKLLLDPYGNYIYDKEMVHPNCKDATKLVVEYMCGKAAQPIEVQGGAGGTRLLFTGADIAAMHVQSAVMQIADEYGEIQEVEILAPESD